MVFDVIVVAAFFMYFLVSTLPLFYFNFCFSFGADGICIHSVCVCVCASMYIRIGFENNIRLIIPSLIQDRAKSNNM